MTISPEVLARMGFWRERLRQELLDNVLPFWLKYSPDPTHGGYFNCLDRDGRCYDTRKHVWMQGRQAWMFSKLYHSLDPNPDCRNPEWLEVARSGVEFLHRFALRSDHRVYFCLSQEGDPVQLQRKIFSECFYVMALAEYSRASGELYWREEANDVFGSILVWVRDLTLVGQSRLKGAPATSELAIPMILLNLIHELNGFDHHDWQEEAQECIQRIRLHVRPELQLVLETVDPDGSLLDSPQGRLVNPGHAIEAGWFLLDYCQKVPDPEVQTMALQMIRWSLECGWDSEEGGLFYFLDREGYSPVQLEWSMKLWWPHCEALIATLRAYEVTGDPAWWQRFEQVADYTFAHFPDPRYGEWFGYLDCHGTVTHRFKGGPYKGCFHVPRALWLGEQILARILAVHS